MARSACSLGRSARPMHSTAASCKPRSPAGQTRPGRERLTQPDKPAVHRRGGVDRDLLFEDDMQERRKAVAAPAEARHAGALEDRAKHRLLAEGFNALIQIPRRILEHIQTL